MAGGGGGAGGSRSAAAPNTCLLAKRKSETSSVRELRKSIAGSCTPATCVVVTKNSLSAAQKIAPAGPPITVGSRNFVREPIMTTAGTAEDRAAIQRYLAEHRVTELLYQVLESICVEKPANPHQYIVDYLSKNHAGLVTVAASDAAAAATAEADDDYVNELLQEDEDDDVDVG